MRYLFILLLLIGCGESPTQTEEQFQSKQIGTWLLDQPDLADWKGSGIQFAKAVNTDTVLIENEGKQDLTLIKSKQSAESSIDLIIQDSTVLFPDQLREDGTIRDDLILDFNKVERLRDNNFVAFNVRGQQGTGNPHEIQLSLSFNCHFILTSKKPAQRLIIDLKHPDNDSTIKVYNFNVDGMLDVANEMIRCNEI